MSILVVCSSRDPASRNIAANLKTLAEFDETGESFDRSPIFRYGDVELVTVETDITECEHLGGRFNPDYAIFASRHRSSTEMSSLTVHVPGIMEERGDGMGSKHELGIAYPVLNGVLLRELKRLAAGAGLDDYKVSLEATHHGPVTLNFPVSFIEIGGGEVQWRNPGAGRVVAGAITAAFKNLPNDEGAVGMGGGHYAPKHTSVVLEGKTAIGHIIPKYLAVTPLLPTVAEAVAKTRGRCTAMILDWKGVSGNVRQDAVRAASELGLSLIRA